MNGASSCDHPARFHFENSFELMGTMGVGVSAENAATGGFADFFRAFGSEFTQMLDHFLAIRGDEQFTFGLEKKFNAFPFVRDEAGAGTGGFKNRGRRCNAET